MERAESKGSSTSPMCQKANDSRADLFPTGSYQIYRGPVLECLGHATSGGDIRAVPLLVRIPSGCLGRRRMEGARPAKDCPDLDSTAVCCCSRLSVSGSAKGWAPRRAEACSLSWLQEVPGSTTAGAQTVASTPLEYMWLTLAAQWSGPRPGFGAGGRWRILIGLSHGGCELSQGLPVTSLLRLPSIRSRWDGPGPPSPQPPSAL